MRFQIISLGLFFPLLSSATLSSSTLSSNTLPTAADVMRESQQVREATSKETSFAKKAKQLQEFEKSLNKTIKQYEKASPAEGGDDEEKVAKFSYRFEALFAMAKQKSTDKGSCEKAKYQIEFLDKSGKNEEAKFSEAAEEALRWLELLCK